MGEANRSALTNPRPYCRYTSPWDKIVLINVVVLETDKKS